MKQFQKQLQAQFDKMCQSGKLFRSSITGQQVWDAWLKGFLPKNDPIFRDPNSSTHNCNLCKNFIRRYGNIVSLNENNKIITIFGSKDCSEEYFESNFFCNEILSSTLISEVFFETYRELDSLPYEKCSKSNNVFRLGIDKNIKRYTKEEAEKFGIVKANDIITFNHMFLDIPKQFVDQSGLSVEQLMANYRDAKNVFQRAMVEIPLDTLILVKDLINQGSLLDGQTHLYKIEQFIPLKKEYDSLSANERDSWCWSKSYGLPFAKFKNELIGVLCSELAEGKELNEACKAWNKRVDPANYMKVTAPFTERMKKDAMKEFYSLGYKDEDLLRRYAVIDDIKASEIKHINIGDGKLKNVSIFDSVKPATSTRHKRSEFDGIEEVNIEKFMSDILPGCSSVEAFLTNKQEGNMVSLTTANDKSSKPIFKWDNNYSWTFNGNLAGKSQIKDAVKSRGGNIIGDLRISLAFPDTTDDYDLHVLDSDGSHIYYSNVRKQHPSSGTLDLDAQGIDGHQIPEKRVENVIFTDKSKIKDGNIKIWVENYSGRGMHIPFDLEIEFGGDITTFTSKSKSISNRYDVGFINVKNNMFSTNIDSSMTLKENVSLSREVYGLQTEQFYKVNLICLSPNHWGENNVGNKHYFFMLEGCKCTNSIKSFHAENLLPELAQHRKVLEVLGNTTMIEPTDKQLSGLGFNATVKDELILKLQGSFKRVIKIKF